MITKPASHGGFIIYIGKSTCERIINADAKLSCNEIPSSLILHDVFNVIIYQAVFTWYIFKYPEGKFLRIEDINAPVFSTDPELFILIFIDE